MFLRIIILRLVFALLLAFGSEAIAQEIPGHALFNAINSNEAFGRKLLREVHSANPDQNVALAPLPIHVAFAAIERNSASYSSSEEIDNAFSLASRFSDTIPMLLVRFQKPRSVSAAKSPLPFSGLLRSSPEELWMSTAFLYRGQNAISQNFIEDSKKDFGLQFHSVDRHASGKKIVARSWDPQVPVPEISNRGDFWITSMMHLRTKWASNTSINPLGPNPDRKSDFLLSSGQHEQVDTMLSETVTYRYAKTDNFEAIVLPCIQAYLMVVLPAEGKDIHQLEEELIRDTSSLDAALKPQSVDVELPKFSFQFEANVRPALEAMGVHSVFKELEFVKIPGSKLTGISQKVRITVDVDGIRADAGTIDGGIYGCILGGGPDSPLHMKVNRPFLFLIRDDVTNSLLFIGAVMDPARH